MNFDKRKNIFSCLLPTLTRFQIPTTLNHISRILHKMASHKLQYNYTDSSKLPHLLQFRKPIPAGNLSNLRRILEKTRRRKLKNLFNQSNIFKGPKDNVLHLNRKWHKLFAEKICFLVMG